MRHERTDCHSAVLRGFCDEPVSKRTSLQHRIEKHSATPAINIVASSHYAAAGDAGKANILSLSSSSSSSSSSLLSINKTTSPTVSTGAVNVMISRRVSDDSGGAVGYTAVRQKSSTDVVVINDNEVELNNGNRLQHLDGAVSHRNASQSQMMSTAYFTCYYCVAAFKRRQQLFDHIAGHFCDDPETQMLPVIIGSAGIILACAMCAMAHRFLKWRIEIFAMRHNGAHFFITAHQQNLGAP